MARSTQRQSIENRISQQKELEEKQKSEIALLVGEESEDEVIVPSGDKDEKIELFEFINWFEKDVRSKIKNIIEQLSDSERENLSFALEQADIKTLEEIKNSLISVLMEDPLPSPEDVIAGISRSGKEIDEMMENVRADLERQKENTNPTQIENSVFNRIPLREVLAQSRQESEKPGKKKDKKEEPEIPCSEAHKSAIFTNRILGKPVESPQNGFGAEEEDILVVPGEEFVRNDEFLYAKWKRYLECFIKNKEAEYFKFSIAKPVKKKILERENSSIPYRYAEIKPHYNFYVENYEASMGSYEDNAIPNMYVFSFSERELSEKRKVNPAYMDLITLRGAQKTELLRPVGQYYDKYAKNYESFKKEQHAEMLLSEQYKSILVPYEETPFFKSIGNTKEQYPMYVDINFTTDQTISFSEILKDSKLTNAFMAEITNRFITGEYEEEMPVKESLLEFSNDINRQNVVEDKTRLKTVDLSEWLETFLKSIEKAEKDRDGSVNVFQNVNYDSVTTLGKYTPEVVMYEDTQYNLHKQILLLTFVSKLKKMIMRYRQSFMDIYNGKLSHSETIFYRISKYAGVSPSYRNLIQSYFIPNSSEVDILNLVDTQVKYEKQYLYDIAAYQIVFGTKLVYSWVADAGSKGALRVISIPTLKVVEVPFYQETVKISDTPPLQPQIEFIPYKDKSEEILINFNGDVGTRKEEPIPIENTDTEMFEDARKTQDLFPDEREITFSADDHPVSFEVYRIENKPFSYSDFKGNLWKNVSTDVDTNSTLKATSASLKDKIEANKKYYYMFRTVDIHGNKSNPSIVYEIEMINDAGFIYPSFKPVEFAEQSALREQAKAMKKRMKIIPTLSQVLINEEASGLSDADSAYSIKNVTLGVKEKSLWGEQFKIRVTSKHSNKKIDINIKFVSTFNRSVSILNEE